MQKSIQKLAAITYGAMTLYWCWILGYSQILKLPYQAFGILDLFTLLAVLALPLASAMLIIIAFLKKEHKKIVNKAIFLMVLNIVFVELSISAAWEFFYASAHQTGQNFFRGTPISAIFDIFSSTTAIVVVTTFNIFSLRHPQENIIFSKNGIKKHINFAKSPYLKAKNFVCVFYSLLAILWSILLVNTALVKPPRGFQTADIVICALSAVLFLATSIFVFAKRFSLKASGMQILISVTLLIIPLLLMLFIRNNDFDIFYQNALDVLFGGFSDNIFVVVLSDVGFLNIVVVALMALIKLSICKEKSNKS